MVPWGRGTLYSGLYGEAPPERGVFFKLAVQKRVGKIAILVYKRVTNQLHSGRNGGYSEVYQRVPHFGRNDYATEAERLKTRENVAITGNSIVLAYP